MARRFYNEHLLYPDPFSAASKSTKHREIKRRKLSAQNTEEPSPTDGLIPGHAETGQSAGCPLDIDPGHTKSVATDPEENDVDVVSDDATEEENLQFLSENDSIHDQNEQLPVDELSTASRSQTVLFQNCPLTVTSSLLLIKKYQMRHNLTQEALSDLLQLMRLHFPTPNLLPRSLYLFNKQLPLLRDLLEFNYFCSRCLQEVSNKDESICTNSSCGCSLSGPGAISSFIEVPLEPQLSTLLQSMIISIVLTLQNILCTQEKAYFPQLKITDG